MASTWEAGPWLRRGCKPVSPPNETCRLRVVLYCPRCLLQVIEEWVASHSSAEVMAAMNEARVPAGPILSTADIAAEPQYQARGMLQKAAPPSGEHLGCHMLYISAT